MEVLFSKPQRQSQIGILILFLHTLQQYVRGLLPVLVLWAFRFKDIDALWLTLGFAFVFGITGIVAYLKYRNFTFYIDTENNEFIINEGVFNKTKTVIQLRKIQQVNITQSLLQRIIGVYALDVDTAGSSKKEGKIRAVSHRLALALKERLLDNEQYAKIDPEAIQTKTDAVISDEKPFIKISFLSLLKIGVTSNYIRTIGLILAFFVTIYDNVRQISESSSYNGENLEAMVERVVMQSVFAMIVALMLAVLAVNLLRVIVQFFNYKITRQSGSLLLSYGLLNTKSTIIKPEKVQITAISRNYFQKKMNILEMKIKQASGGDEKEQRRSAIEIPGCNENERDAILKLLFNSVPEKGVMLKPNFRKLGFSVFLLIVVPLCGFYSLAEIAEPRFYEFSYLVPIYAIFVGLVLIFGFRNYRLFINDAFIIKQSGAWDIKNEIIEPSKIQAITTSQLFWHKSLNIGSLTIHTAGGNISFQLGNYETVKQYVNLWLYRIEKSDSNWM